MIDDELAAAAERINRSLAHIPIPPPPTGARRSRSTAGIVAAAATLVTIAAIVPILDVRDPTPTAPSTTSPLEAPAATTSPPTEETGNSGDAGLELTPEDRHLITRLPLVGSPHTLPMYATVEPGSTAICVELQGASCGPVPDAATPLSMPSVSSDSQTGSETSSCAYGAIWEQVASLMLSFDDGSVVFPARVATGWLVDLYGYCWQGDLQLVATTAFDAEGTALSTTSDEAISSAPFPPLFGDASDVALIFDDGIEGLLAVDPDSRIAARTSIDGQRAGDQPYRLYATDGFLVAGWGEIVATDIQSGAATSLGEATIFVPASEPGRVWLVDYPTGRVGGGVAEARLVTVHGDVLSGPRTVDAAGVPARGVPGGLAVETADGIEIWSDDSGEATMHLGTGGPGFVGDAHGDHLVWCALECDTLTVTDLGSADEFTVSGQGFDVRAARFSPDGSLLAVPSVDGEVLVLDADGGLVESFAAPALEAVSLAWAPDGTAIYASSYGYGADAMQITRHELGGGTTFAAIPSGGGIGLVVVPRPDADRLFEVTVSADRRTCPTGFLSGRDEGCGFRF